MNILHKLLPVVVLIMLITGKTYAQQDPQYNVGFVNPTFINPGYAGNNAEDLFCASAFNRLELRGFDGAPVSTIINVQGPVDIFGIHSGISATLKNEMAGYLRAPEFNLGYAYRRKAGDGSLGIGVSLGVVSSWYDNESWILPDGSATDPATPTQKTAGVSFDMGLGAYYSNTRWFAGVSVTHLTSPSLGVDKNAKYKPTLYLSGGYSFMLDTTKWVLKPMANVVSDFTQVSYNIACNVVYQTKYWAGINYRWGQAVAAMIGFQIFEGINIAYSYEYPTSKLAKFSSGTHELMFSYSFAVKVPRGIQRYKSVRYL